ncbi:MAG: hypothetical protein Kow00133_12580 [Amphiplicatus sp.]
MQQDHRRAFARFICREPDAAGVDKARFGKASHGENMDGAPRPGKDFAHLPQKGRSGRAGSSSPGPERGGEERRGLFRMRRAPDFRRPCALQLA